MDYVSNTEKEREYMLKEIGVEAIEEIFNSIPKDIKLKRGLDIEDGLSELELKNHIKNCKRK